jgi:transcription elongation GreA/GreB family factor
MRTPTRKPGTYSNLKPDPHITREKYDELSHKLQRLKSALPGLIEEVKRLALDGDFSENAAYQIAKGRLRATSRRIDEIGDHLKFASIIEPVAASGAVVLGSKVTVAFNGVEKTYTILGSSETNPSTGIISHLSPLGSVLIGKKRGDFITIKRLDKETRYEIIKIE